MSDVIVTWWCHKIRLQIENEGENEKIFMNKMVFIFDSIDTIKFQSIK